MPTLYPGHPGAGATLPSVSQFRGEQGTYAAENLPPREGGQASVYAAHDGARRVAIKVAKVPGPWLRREREALTRLQSAGITADGWLVRLLDHGRTADGRDFLVLEWFPESLGDWLEREHPVEEVLRALALAAEAVAKLHAAAGLRDQFLHLDVKPWNFLIDASGSTPRVVLADLGGVKQGRLLATTLFLGHHSPGYAPLEQELSLARAPDPSIDVHGLAATIYAGLCGRLPDARQRPAALLPGGRRLDLLQRIPSREATDEAEFERLRRLPVEDLIAFDEMEPLTTTDEARLQNRLIAALVGRTADAEGVGRRLADLLIPVLRAGLDPDPRLREKRVGPLYAAVAEGCELVERAVGGSETLTLGPAPVATTTHSVTADTTAARRAGPGGLGDLGEAGDPAPGPSPSGEPPPVVGKGPVREYAPRVADAVDAYLQRASRRGERSVGRTRLVLLAAAFASELLVHTPAEWADFPPRVWVSPAFIAVGAAASIVLLRNQRRPDLVAWASVALDALLVAGVSLPAALWPPAGYPGQGHSPSFAFFLLAIVAAGMRLSRSVLRFAIAMNTAGAVALLLVDRWKGAAVLPLTTQDLVLWTALFVGASFFADAVVVRTRRMVAEGAESAVKAERGRQALGVYVSEEVASEAMAEGLLAPGGRRQAVAVLHCELQGFDRYAGRVSPERLVTELNGFLEVVVAAVGAHGGVVDRYMGDALLVVFGVPQPRPDASSSAVSAAAGMSAALVAHNLTRASAGLPPLRMAIGVHAGEVIVGNVGTPERLQYTVVGNAVNRARQLEQAARALGVEVVISEVVAQTVGVLPGAVQLVRAGTAAIGDGTESVPVWTLVGIEPKPPGT